SNKMDALADARLVRTSSQLVCCALRTVSSDDQVRVDILLLSEGTDAVFEALPRSETTSGEDDLGVDVQPERASIVLSSRCLSSKNFDLLVIDSARHREQGLLTCSPGQLIVTVVLGAVGDE